MKFFLRMILTLLLMFVITGCSSPLLSSFNSDTFSPETESHSLLERLELESQSADAGVEGAETQASLSNESLLTEIDTVQVKTLIESQPFQTLARSGEITQYPCSSCHIEPLADLQSAQGLAAPKAHWNIEIDHADESVMTCTTCHSSDNMDTLHTLTNEPVSFDHSYQVCAQCHSGIAEDWAGGAHGKRVGGWTPPRVVNNCTDCHNPHQPQWDIRWPSVTNSGSTK